MARVPSPCAGSQQRLRPYRSCVRSPTHTPTPRQLLSHARRPLRARGTTRRRARAAGGSSAVAAQTRGDHPGALARLHCRRLPPVTARPRCAQPPRRARGSRPPARASPAAQNVAGSLRGGPRRARRPRAAMRSGAQSPTLPRQARAHRWCHRVPPCSTHSHPAC